MSKLQVGDTFAGYTVECELGSGGMGEVYLVRHPRLPRRDALKVLGAPLAGDEHFRARFEREADLAARLSHPNIVKVHDRGEYEGRLWIAFEYIEGQDLAELTRTRPLPPAEAGRIIGEVAGALDDAGRRGLIHRDVKPANIMIDASGRALLTDFGIARAREDTAQLTVTGTTLGTLAFASPEQLRDQPVDPRSDQYSLACSAFVLVTGTVPCVGASPTATIFAHVQDPIPSACARNRRLPAVVDQVFYRALAKNPGDRFGDSRSFAVALNEALRGVPAGVPAGPAAVPAYASTVARTPAASTGRKRSTTALLLVALSVAALLVAGITAFALRSGTPPPGSTVAGSQPVVAAAGHSLCAGLSGGNLGCAPYFQVDEPLADTGLRGVTAVATTDADRCAVAEGDLYCWGTRGGLIGDSATAEEVSPRRVEGLGTVTAVAMSESQACAVSDGDVYCWGRLSHADRTTTSPEKVPGISGATAIVLGSLVETDSRGTTVCAVADASAWCWGDNYQGSAGAPVSVTSVTTPTEVAVPGRVTAVQTVGMVSCALGDGDVYCWGDRSGFTPGVRGTYNDDPAAKARVQGPAPVKLDGIDSAQTFALGRSPVLMAEIPGLVINEPVLCAVAGGEVACRGDNGYGQLGDGTTGRTDDPVRALPGVSDVTAVAVGTEFACASTADSVLCWGQLNGRSTSLMSATPVQLPG